MTLCKMGFERMTADQAVFVKIWRDGQRLIIAVHVDDCLITGSEQKLVDEFKESIKNNHAITDLGPCQ